MIDLRVEDSGLNLAHRVKFQLALAGNWYLLLNVHWATNWTQLGV